MSSIKCSVDCQVGGGPRVSFTEELTVNTYDFLEFTVPSSGTLKVHIAPAPSANNPLSLLVIRALGTAAQNAKTSFANATEHVSLSRPVVLIGDSIGLLAAMPGDMDFNNDNAVPVVVTVMVGRDA